MKCENFIDFMTNQKGMAQNIPATELQKFLTITNSFLKVQKYCYFIHILARLFPGNYARCSSIMPYFSSVVAHA